MIKCGTLQVIAWNDAFMHIFFKGQLSAYLLRGWSYQTSQFLAKTIRIFGRCSSKRFLSKHLATPFGQFCVVNPWCFCFSIGPQCLDSTIWNHCLVWNCNCSNTRSWLILVELKKRWNSTVLQWKAGSFNETSWNVPHVFSPPRFPAQGRYDFWRKQYLSKHLFSLTPPITVPCFFATCEFKMTCIMFSFYVT